MSKSILPLTFSSKTTDITLGDEALEVNPFANAGLTAADAPVLLSLGSKGTVDADTLASRMAKAGGHGSKSEARLFLNALAEVMGEFADEYGAFTVQTPFGTVQTFIAGTIANPQDQPDPAVNYAFLGVVIPEAYRRLFAQIGTYVPTEACPAALKRIRDKATNESGIHGTDPFYLEGRGMTHGGDGETLELLDASTRDKLCDIAVDADSKSTVQFLCTLTPQTAIEAGTYVVLLKTLAGGEKLWPFEIEAELVEAIPAPEPVPIAESSDGSVKVFSVEDNGQSGTFNLSHEWTMRGSGFQRGDAPSGLYVDNVSVAAGEHEANFNSLDITGETVKLSDAQAGQIPAGSYPNAQLKVALTDAQSGEIEILTIPVNLIVEA